MLQADSKSTPEVTTLPAGESLSGPMPGSGAPEKPLQRVPGVKDATRRLLTILAAGAATVGVGRIAIASPSADPVYAVIDAHRTAWVAYSAALAVDDGDGPDVSAASIAEQNAQIAIAEAEPTTLPGVVALLRYVGGYYQGTHEHLQRVRENGEPYGSRHQLFIADEFFEVFVANLADAIERQLGVA